MLAQLLTSCLHTSAKSTCELIMNLAHRKNRIHQNGDSSSAVYKNTIHKQTRRPHTIAPTIKALTCAAAVATLLLIVVVFLNDRSVEEALLQEDISALFANKERLVQTESAPLNLRKVACVPVSQKSVIRAFESRGYFVRKIPKKLDTNVLEYCNKQVRLLDWKGHSKSIYHLHAHTFVIYVNLTFFLLSLRAGDPSYGQRVIVTLIHSGRNSNLGIATIIITTPAVLHPKMDS